MKYYLILILFLFSISINTNAQVTYQTAYSNPEDVYPGYLGLHYFAVDAGFSNTSGASIWSVGADGLYPINDKIGVDVLALYSMFSLAKEGPAFLFNGGIEFEISKQTKPGKVPVLLAFSYEKDYINNKEVQTWESVTLQAGVQKEFVARGGIYLRNSALEYDQGTTYFDQTRLFQAGVYAGIGYNWKSYIHVRDSDGYTFAAGKFIRPYADLLVIPTTVDLELNGAKAAELDETLGWRVGAILVAKPYTKSENFDRKFGFFGNSIFRMEFGQRPIGGFFVTTGVAFALKKFN
jgi:hypothetical protein